MKSEAADPPPGSPTRVLALALGALGVVHGDIGTSPLYALRVVFSGPRAVEPTEAEVLGVLSLVFWTLVVVSVKYLGFVLEADNRGEGGVFALASLATERGTRLSARARTLVMLSAVVAVAFLFGDGIVTPVITVYAAVDGLRVAHPHAGPLVLPVAAVALLVLFLSQRRATSRLGAAFGPLMLLWFVAIGALGAVAVARRPSVLAAVNPAHALEFVASHRAHALLALAGVFLCVSGAEAFPAGLGHFGKRPIRLGWLGVALPALLACYFGQGALIIERPEAADSPFFGLVPRPLLPAMILLATGAALVASQAVISACFSLTRQAVQLGYFPRVNLLHVAGGRKGQVFVPGLAGALAAACVALTVAAGDLSTLAAAYGLAVSVVMAITTGLHAVVVTQAWAWASHRAVPLVGLFALIDATYLVACLARFPEGGWLPVALALAVGVSMTTWRRGREELAHRMRKGELPLDLLLDDVAKTKPHRVRGTAVFMSSSIEAAPPALLHHLKHNRVLHQRVVLLAVKVEPKPFVAQDERVAVERLREGFFRVTARYGFMETPDVPDAMERTRALGLDADPGTTSYFLSRETLLTAGRSEMARWRKRLFAFLSRNSRPATHYFGIPPGRVVELGIQVEL